MNSFLWYISDSDLKNVTLALYYRYIQNLLKKKKLFNFWGTIFVPNWKSEIFKICDFGPE